VPDVDGTIYLDPKTFQIRRSIVRLNGHARIAPDVLNVEVTTIFGEVFASVPAIATVSSLTRFKPDFHQLPRLTGRREDHRLLGIRFLDRKPGEDLRVPR